MSKSEHKDAMIESHYPRTKVILPFVCEVVIFNYKVLSILRVKG